MKLFFLILDTFYLNSSKKLYFSAQYHNSELNNQSIFLVYALGADRISNFESSAGFDARNELSTQTCCVYEQR